MAKGPLGFQRLTSIGPLVKETNKFGQDVSREEFIQQCMDSEAAKEFGEGFIRSIVDDQETADEILQGTADEQLKRDFCEGLADRFASG